MDLHLSAFTYGQLYVALSRATNFDGVSILLTEDGDRKIDNIIYPEVLLHPSIAISDAAAVNL